MSESRATWATSVPILVFIGLSVLNLGLLYATDRRQTDRQTSDAHHRLMPPTLGARYNNMDVFTAVSTKIEDAFVSAILSGHYIVAVWLVSPGGL